MATTTTRTGAWAASLLFAGALLTSAPIWWQFAVPIFDGAHLPNHKGHLGPIIGHAIGGTFMIWAGAGALFIGWTGRLRRLHKWFGYAYLGGGSLGATIALWLSTHLAHPPLSVGVATGTLAAFWLLFAGMALRAALNRRFDSHREWVIRSYVLTWTFVGCRIAQEVPLFGALKEEGVTAGIWLYWVAPILICEVGMQWTRGGRDEPRRGVAGRAATVSGERNA
jgi:hypothetical protein